MLHVLALTERNVSIHIATMMKTSSLKKRKEDLENLIRSLREELRFVESELHSIEPKNAYRLDEHFFNGVVYPLLLNEEKGLFAKQLLKEIHQREIPIKDSQLRLFLTRYKSKGFLKLNRRAYGPGKWALAVKHTFEN
jgi:hypothetical protein